MGPRRWAAVGVGLIGVFIILRPGTSSFQLASLLPIAAAFGYAGLHIMTRYLRDTESALSMVFYIQLMFIAATLTLGLIMGDGKFAGGGNLSLDFLFRAWVVPDRADLPLLLILGVFASVGRLLHQPSLPLGRSRPCGTLRIPRAATVDLTRSADF